MPSATGLVEHIFDGLWTGVGLPAVFEVVAWQPEVEEVA
jgi:hypothetical protein